MPEIVMDLEPRVLDEREHAYDASAVADPAPDGHWNVSIEFVSPVTGAAFRTGTETHQATRRDVFHWAGGLSDVYLRGALARAVLQPATSADGAHGIDLFELFAQGAHVLHRTLRPLGRRQLLRLIDTHDLNPAHVDVGALDRSQLLTFITTAVEAQDARHKV